MKQPELLIIHIKYGHFVKVVKIIMTTVVVYVAALYLFIYIIFIVRLCLALPCLSRSLSGPLGHHR